MKLRDLGARFLRWEQREETRTIANDPANYPAGGTHEVFGPVDYFVPVKTLAEAHGIRFICPAAYQKQGGPVGAHSVRVFFDGSPVPPHLGQGSDGGATRWKASGSSLEDLTLTPSIQEIDDGLCGWHGFVTNGNAA